MATSLTWKQQYDLTPTFALDEDTALLYSLQGAYDATGNKVGLKRDLDNPLPNCRVATPSALNATYNNGDGTLTNAGALAAISIDGTALSLNDKVLVTEQASPEENGLYYVSTVGSGAAAWVLTRHASFTNVEQMRPGRTVSITDGDNLQGSIYVLDYPAPAVIGTDPIAFNSMLLTTLNLIDAYLPLDGSEPMIGALTLSGDPTLPLQAVTKQYADNIAAGLNPIPGVVAASTGALTATYANGTGGIGATLTNSGALAAFSLDGQSPTVGQRVLIKNQASTFQNGIYTVTTVGSGAVAWVLTRATDYDTASEISPGDIVFIELGTVNAGATYYQSATVATIGTDPITFAAFFTPATYLQVANNLSELTATAATARGNISAAKSGANTDITSLTGLTGVIQAPTAIRDANGNNILAFSSVPSAVNYFTFTNTATGIGLSITPTGSDSSIPLAIYNKNSQFFFKDSANVNDAIITLINAAGSNSCSLAPHLSLGGSFVFRLPGSTGVAGTLLTTNGSDQWDYTTLGQIKGEPSNTAAAVGNIGEILESTIVTGSAVGLTSGASANITSLLLTPGEWDVYGMVVTKPAAGTTTSIVQSAISTTTGTLPGTGNASLPQAVHTGAVAANGIYSLFTGMGRQLISSNTTVYLVANVTFAVSTMAAFGWIRARRVR